MEVSWAFALIVSLLFSINSKVGVKGNDDIARRAFLVDQFNTKVVVDDGDGNRVQVCQWHGGRCSGGSYQRVMTNSELQSTNKGVGRNETDQQALLEFKSLITGDQFEIMKWWNKSIHFCHWPGITCSRRHQRVIKLDLQSKKLMGSISPYIGNLSFLRVLNLQNNSFSHEIPQEVGRLRRLQVLQLNNNSLVGEIPSNISSCSKLRVVDLSYNKLDGESLLFLAAFQTSELSGSIPEGLDRLTNLILFSAALNELSGAFPSSLFNLSNLLVLDIASNRIQGNLPWDLKFTLPSLEVFSIGGNQLNGTFPASISNASNLLELTITGNSFTGTLHSFYRLQKLQWFNVAINLLGSRGVDDLNFLCTLINATDLQVLTLGKNNFGGIIPNCISNLSVNLAMFTIGDNEIWGRIPDGIGNLINLEMLTADNNKLSGYIPPSIGMLQRLQKLTITRNSLLGNIPHTFGNLKLLTVLGLSRNNLHGNIPSNLSECKSLIALDLSNNNLSGTIPPKLAGLSSLSILLSLYSNQLTGELPREIGNLKNLVALDVSDNMLSGVIPSTLGSCVELGKLLLGDNLLQGPIPESLISLRGLEVLVLFHNNLSGEIPEYLGSFQSLHYLDLAYNNFEGIVPSEGVFRNSSAIFIEGNNKLCGGPLELHLPRCKLSRSRTNSRKVIIATIFGILGVTFLFSLLVLLLSRKKRKQPTISSYLENSLLQLSYQSILKATNGFSSTNLVGAGSFGSVYKGTFEETGVVVAIKVLNRLSQRASKSFISECETMRNVRHRNLVKILTACSSVDYQGNDFKALVYEFMVHGSLEDWLHIPTGTNEAEEAPKKLDFPHRLNIAIDVACALEYLHHHCATSIVHCDLKPSNILLDDDMVGHVGDFGLAKFMSDDMQNYSTNLASSSGLKGTVGYVAPEYGMGNKVSASSDVYSFGILLLEMFTARRPTDEMFKDELNLRSYVKLALPDTVAEITDPILLQETIREERIGNQSKQLRDRRFLECLISIFHIGITCSAKSPSKRINMTNATAELISIRDKLLPTRSQLHH